MQIEVADNPNCPGSEQMVYRELGPARPVRAIRVQERGKEILCEVVGVEPARPPKSPLKNAADPPRFVADAAGAVFVGAKAAKIADSGAGFAFLIFGGAWGIRLRPEAYAKEPWDFSNRHQWGEPFKIYGAESDLIYG